MKTITITLIIMVLYVPKNWAQITANILTDSEYSAVEANGVLLTSIESTNGNPQLMENLLGVPLSIEEEGSSIGEKQRKFIYDLQKIVVFDGLSLNQTPSMVYLETNSITIKNVTISIGDYINILGSQILKNQNEDGSESIIYSKEGGDCCLIIIEYDNLTNKVSSIKYLEWT